MKRTVLVSVSGHHLSVEVETPPPMGWRFWTFAGFPADPFEPRPYGGSRGIPLATIDTPRGGVVLLVAMELDGAAQLFTPHELFPCSDQEGAEGFGLDWVERHAVQPSLFDHPPAQPKQVERDH